VTKKNDPGHSKTEQVHGDSSDHLVTLSPCHLVIFLVGFRGSGKSTVAGLVAQRLGWQAVDADTILEALAGKMIRDIFAEEGEAGFRSREEMVLKDLCRRPQHVIATGGGVVLAEGNRLRMRRAGKVVWLQADAETIWQRLQGDATTAQHRPVLTVGGLPEVEQLLRVREPLYRESADWTVDTTGHTPEEVAELILNWWSTETRRS
jgi:shikimate kinase